MVRGGKLSSSKPEGFSLGVKKQNQEEYKMKMFKKIMAVALAAVMMLAMVGCSESSPAAKLTKQDIVRFLNDAMISQGRDLTCNETGEMDKKAEALLATAQKNYEKEKSASVMELLTSEEAATAAQINTKTDSYMLNFSENPDYRSAVPADKRGDYIIDSMARNRKFIGVDRINTSSTIDIGLAFGKIGDTEYIILLQVRGNK